MSGSDLTLPAATGDEVALLLGGVSTVQTVALTAGDAKKVVLAGEVIARLAEENPDQVREAFLAHNEDFQINKMPDEILDHLDLEVRGETLYERTDGDTWTEVEVDD